MPTEFTTLLSATWGEIAAVVSVITASAILMIPIGFKFCRGAIGLAKSLMGTGGGRRR